MASKLGGFCRIRSFLQANFDRFDLISLAIIFISSLVVFTWISPHLIVDSFDYGFSFAPDVTFNISSHLWDTHGGIGTLSARPLAGLLPNNLYYYLSVDILGLSLQSSQLIQFYVLLSASGLSMYLLFRSLGLDQKYRYGGLFAALLYMFSPISSTFNWNQFASNYYSYSFIPLIAALVIYGYRTRKGILYGILVAGLWTVLITASYMNPVNCIFDWAVVIFLMGGYYFLDPERKPNRMVFLVALIAIWIIMNLFWIVPNINNASEEFARADVAIIGSSNLELLMSNSVPAPLAFLQTGYWGLTGTYLGDHWYSWSWLASSLVFYVACFVIAVSAFAVIWKRPRTKKLLPFGVLAILCIVAINGTYPPFGGFVEGLFRTFPELYSFRSLVQKIGPVLALCYSIMAGAMAGLLVGRIVPLFKSGQIRKRSLRELLPIPVFAALCLSIMIIAVPYLNGEIIYEGGKVIPSARVEIPSYYQDANKWLNEQEGDFRVLSLPYCKIGYAAYSWDNGFWASDPSTTIFAKTFLSNEYGEVNDLLINLVNGLANDSLSYNASKMLSLLNVRYVMLHQDANWAFINGHQWWAASGTNFTTYQKNLDSNGFRLAETTGELYLYENLEWRDARFYQTDTLVVVDGLDGLKDLTNKDWFDVGRMAVLTDPSQLDIWGSSVTGSLQIVYASSFDESLYVSRGGAVHHDTVRLEDPTSHGLVLNQSLSFLVFSERYDDGWEMSQGLETGSHFKVNGFFNGWIISSNGTNYSSVSFLPQDDWNGLVAISATLLAAISVTVVSIAIFRRRSAIPSGSIQPEDEER
jgi:hypothetical protein